MLQLNSVLGYLLQQINFIIISSLIKTSIFKKPHLNALKALFNDKSIYVTKPDKEQGEVILNQSDYIWKVRDVIDDETKFCNITTREKSW